jgi:hypothetical protein
MPLDAKLHPIRAINWGSVAGKGFIFSLVTGYWLLVTGLL